MLSSLVLGRFLTSRWPAPLLFAVLFLIYNSNGREIGGYDSQPAKFAACELALHGTMTLDRVVRRTPQFAERPAFATDRAGHYRSAYSPVPVVFGAATAWMLTAIVRIDRDAVLLPNIVAVVTASALVAAAVVLVFLTLRRFSRPWTALWIATGLGLGTNYWGAVSRTLGQHESVAFGLALGLYAWTRPADDLTRARRWAGAFGLAVASTARLQTAPMVMVLCLGLLSRVGWRRAVGPLALVAAAVLALAGVQQLWFGSPFGAVPKLESLHPAVHAVTGSLSSTPWRGAAGLLISPNRGLFIFSPVALIPLFGLRRGIADRRGLGIAWLVAGAVVQYLVYAMYSVWWGGHTFGPRYMLDLLVPLTPTAAIALEGVLATPVRRALCAAALTWSILVAGTGAFYADHWNTAPEEVDLHHERLWDWRDTQIARAWHSGPSGQNFDLFNRASFQRAP